LTYVLQLEIQMLSSFSIHPSASEMSTDDSEREDGDGDEGPEDDHPGYRRGLRKGLPDPPKPSASSERWESGSLSGEAKPPSLFGQSQEPVSPEAALEGREGKRRGQLDPEGEKAIRKRKSEGSLKSPTKAKTRNTRSADWLPGGSPRKEERGAEGPAAEERRATSDSSSEDEGARNSESRTEDSERSWTKTKGSPSKKYNGMKEKTKASRPAAFWDIPEKRLKMSASAEEKPAMRAKGQKDVWSSIQAQWPKKTLKELFSDSDTEAANSPPPPPDPTRPSVQDKPQEEEEEEQQDAAGPRDEASDEQLDQDKLQREFPSSGSNSVLNTPPTTPESPSTAGLPPSEDPGQARPPSPPPPATATAADHPTAPSESTSSSTSVLPPGPPPEEVAAGGRSETDSSTVEVESLGGGELQDLPQEDGAASPAKAFEASLSCHSDCSLELSSSSQQENEQKPKGTKRTRSVPSQCLT